MQWLHSCCFCLGLKIASSLPLCSSGWAKAERGTHGQEGKQVGNTQVLPEWAQPRGHRGPPRGDRNPPEEMGDPPGGNGRPPGGDRRLRSCILTLTPQKLPQGRDGVPRGSASEGKEAWKDSAS